jgi:Ca-activated chloride channel family protein
MTSHVLGLTLALDERGLPPEASARVHLVAEIAARGPAVARDRPPLSVVLAVDTSGSMVGPPLEQVLRSIDRLVTLLEPTDRIGVVSFADDATEVAPLMSADGAARRMIAGRVNELVAEGGTNIEAGLRGAAAMMTARRPNERQVILLLSDGAPNRGAATAAALGELARSLRPDIGVSTLGYGAQHHEDLLGAISEGGAGRYHFIADPSVCAPEFAQAIGAQADIVAEAVTLAFQLSPGVEIVRILGEPAMRFGAAGLTIDVPDLLDRTRHLIVAELAVRAPREAGPWSALRGSLAYHRAGERTPLTIEATLTVIVGGEARAVVPAARAQALVARADEVRGDARALADRGQFDGAGAALRALIAAIQAEPWFADEADGAPIVEAVAQLVDEAAAMARKPSQEEYRAFRKSQFRAALSVAAPAMASGPMSIRAAAYVAGPLPKARLVVIAGDEVGRSIPLTEPKAIIGRTAAAEIRIASADISRQHAMIVGQGGQFLLIDLGSTSATLVNGHRLGRPWPLTSGDVVRVGDVEMRYEIAPT